MTNEEGSKEKIAFDKAKKEYLATGKRYSSLLGTAMKLDPNVLRIAEDIMATGDGLSAYDNHFLTNFYKELRSKSKIDKRYYDLLLEIKKTKSELDNAVATMSRHRVNFLLRRSGIPPKRTNLNNDIIAAQINSSELSLLEKISLPGVLNVESTERLDELIASGEITLESGSLSPKTKAAREFVRRLEREMRQETNDKYLLTGEQDFLRRYSKLDVNNLLEFVRISADTEHIREIERRIDAGDISLADGSIAAKTPKGKKYLQLLVEELGQNLNKKVKAHLLAKNTKHVESDARLGAVEEKLSDLDIKLSKHGRVRDLAVSCVYTDLLDKSAKHKTSLDQAFAELMTLQETVAASFVDIKKQLLTVLSKSKVDIDKILALLVAVRYVSIFENKYEAKLTELEGKLGIVTGDSLAVGGLESFATLSERYPESDLLAGETNEAIREMITGRLDARRELGDKTNETIVQFLLGSPLMADYRGIVSSQQAGRKHLVDTLYSNDCLYRGMGNISEILAEIAELEVEKAEKLADLAHELELAHKEFWLAKIANNNQDYIFANFGELPEESKQAVTKASREAIATARKEIRDTLSKYRLGHQKHSEEFAKTLRDSLAKISKGGDVSKISAELKLKYKEMSASHESLMNQMEKDMIALEKRLTDFENDAPAVIEKLLISDIRANI